MDHALVECCISKRNPPTEHPLMPELPEVEVLVRHLAPLLHRRTIRSVRVLRAKVLEPTSVRIFTRVLRGATFTDLSRRGKFLLFTLRMKLRRNIKLLGHLGMTGRMYLLPVNRTLPKHASVVLGLGRQKLVFEDTRYFGRLTLETSAIERLGPEPLEEEFTPRVLGSALHGSKQAVKTRLLDQHLIAGIGNIYASEALFRAGISPRLAAGRLKQPQIARLWQAIRETLSQAIEFGSTLPLNHDGGGARDGLFYFGSSSPSSGNYEERLLVYDREGESCVNCCHAIKRIVQTARSTFYCPGCQK